MDSREPMRSLSDPGVLSAGRLRLVRRLARLPPLEARTARAPLARAVSSPRGRHQFYTVRLEHGAAEPAFKGSGDITSMARADGYFEIPADVQRVEAGEEVEITLF